MNVFSNRTLGSVAFWRAISLALALALVLVLSQQEWGAAPTQGPEEAGAIGSMQLLELLWFGTDEEVRQLHGALERMIAGETGVQIEGRAEQVRRQFEPGGPLHGHDEIALALLLAVPARESSDEEDTFLNSPFEER